MRWERFKILSRRHLSNIIRGKSIRMRICLIFIIILKFKKKRRFRRATHVTPKSYLNFISGYKNIYQLKQTELGDGVEKMETGLEKLLEASASVEILKKDLAIMELDLAEASQKVHKNNNSKIYDDR